MVYPWSLVLLADMRLADDEREALWHNFVEMKECCIPPGFGRSIWAKAQANLPEAWAWWSDKGWQRFWWFFSQLITLQCADIEWRHGRNRSRNHRAGQTGMSSFASRYVQGEANTNS